MKPKRDGSILEEELHSADPASVPSRWVTACYLVLLLVVAFLLRAWFASGWPGPSRVWDERYSFENVASVLETGKLEPVRNFYPSPLYYAPPALAILAAEPFVENPKRALFDPDRDRFGPTAYHLSRGIQVLYGTASVLLIYLLGATMFGRPVALLAATILAFIPWHIQVSGVFKPDAQVVFFLLVVLIAGVRWMRSPTALAALGVGAAVAAATSSKLIAGVSGTAFAFGGAVRAHFGPSESGPTDRIRGYGQILLAGAASVAVFVLVNPSLEFVLGGLEDIKWDYARRAQWAGMTKAQIPARTLAYLLGAEVFGPVFGALALVGYLALWISGLRAARSQPASVAGPRLMLAAFPLLYVVVHTLQSAWFRNNNFTHILPPFALALAWVLVELLRFGRHRLRMPRPVLALVGVGVGGLLIAPGPLFVYRTYTPTTLDIAYKTIGAQPAEAHGRIVVQEPVEAPGVRWRIGDSLAAAGAAVLHVSSAAELSDERRRRSDAEILLGRVPNKRSPSRVVKRRVVSPELGERRGPELTVLLHPWTRRATYGPLPFRLHRAGALAFELPRREISMAASVVLRVRRPPALIPETEATVTYRDETALMYRVDPRSRRFDLVSERFRCCRAAGTMVRIEGLPALEPADLRVFLVIWSPPERSRPPRGVDAGRPQPSSGSESGGEGSEGSEPSGADLFGPH